MLATFSLWVTIIKVIPEFFNLENIFNISNSVFSSNEPVGSSAKIIFDFLTNALAIATLCFSPPERFFIFFWARWDISKVVNIVFTRFCISDFLIEE